MSASDKRRQPSSGSSVDALPAAWQRAFPQQWRSRRVKRDRHEETDELLRRLDDLVIDASDFPSPREPFVHSTPSPRPHPCSGDYDQSSLASLMGVVFGRRADGTANQRGSWSTGARVWADVRRALESNDYTDAQADGAGCVGARLHHAGDGDG